MSHIYRYSIIRFRPFADTDEFANIGILTLDPYGKRIAYRLAPRRFGRIHGFFDTTAYEAYGHLITYLHAELARYTGLFGQSANLSVDKIFDYLIERRESSIVFSEARLIQTDISIDEVSDRLFARLVKREQVTPPNPELKMTQGIRAALHRHGLRQFKSLPIADDVVPIKFPLAVRRSSIRAIQPLAFSQKTPMAVLDHGALWRQRLGYLIDKGKIQPYHVFMAIKAPDADSETAVLEAYYAARRDLGELPLYMEDSAQDGGVNPAVIAFAAQAVSPYPLPVH